MNNPKKILYLSKISFNLTIPIKLSISNKFNKLNKELKNKVIAFEKRNSLGHCSSKIKSEYISMPKVEVCRYEFFRCPIIN